MVRAWHRRGMASVNQTQPHCVNQMGKPHSKPLAAQHVMCKSAIKDYLDIFSGLKIWTTLWFSPPALCRVGISDRKPASTADGVFSW